MGAPGQVMSGSIRDSRPTQQVIDDALETLKSAKASQARSEAIKDLAKVLSKLSGSDRFSLVYKHLNSAHLKEMLKSPNIGTYATEVQWVLDQGTRGQMVFGSNGWEKVVRQDPQVQAKGPTEKFPKHLEEYTIAPNRVKRDDRALGGNMLFINFKDSPLEEKFGITGVQVTLYPNSKLVSVTVSHRDGTISTLNSDQSYNMYVAITGDTNVTTTSFDFFVQRMQDRGVTYKTIADYVTQ